MGYSPRGRKESDMTEQLLSSSLCLKFGAIINNTIIAKMYRHYFLRIIPIEGMIHIRSKRLWI